MNPRCLNSVTGFGHSFDTVDGSYVYFLANDLVGCVLSLWLDALKLGQCQKGVWKYYMMALPFDGIALYLGIYGIADIHLDIVHFRFIFLENWYFWSWYSDLW